MTYNEIANNSSQVKQLKSYQKMADSFVTQQKTTQLKTTLNNNVIQLMSAAEAEALDGFVYRSVNLVSIGENPYHTADGEVLWKYTWMADEAGHRNIELHWHGGAIQSNRINIRWEGEVGAGVGRQIPQQFMAALRLKAQQLGWV